MSPAHANGATSSHASSPGGIDLDPALAARSALNDAQVHTDLKEHIMLVHNECMKCLRELDGRVELIRHDIKTLRDEQRQEFAALRLDFAKQFDLMHSKLSQFLSAIPRPVAASPASHLQDHRQLLQQQQPQRRQYPPPRTSEASASQPESVNRMLKRKGHPEDERIKAENVSPPQSPVNDKEVTIICATRGDFGQSVGWRYPGVDATAYMVSIEKEGCGYNELVEKLSEKLDIDRRLHHLDLSASFKNKSHPVPIRVDEDVEWLISIYGRIRRFPPILCVNIKTKNNMK